MCDFRLPLAVHFALAKLHSIYSKPNKYPNKFDAPVSTWLRCRPRHTSVCLRPPPCPALTGIVSFCPSIYLDCYRHTISSLFLKYVKYVVIIYSGEHLSDKIHPSSLLIIISYLHIFNKGKKAENQQRNTSLKALFKILKNIKQ